MQGVLSVTKTTLVLLHCMLLESVHFIFMHVHARSSTMFKYTHTRLYNHEM